MLTCLDELKSNPVILQLIKNALSKKHMPRALLFHGPQSCGKMSLALSLAKTLHCQVKKNNFCNLCPNCQKIHRFQHPNLLVVNTDSVFVKIQALLPQFFQNQKPQTLEHILFYLNDLFYRFYSGFFSLKTLTKKTQSQLQEKTIQYQHTLSVLQQKQTLQAKELKNLEKIIQHAKQIYEILSLSHIPLKTIRQIIEKLSIKKNKKNHTCIIIKNLESMTQDASNTFLKSLEETPQNNTIILITQDLKSVLPTIASRCFSLDFHPLTLEHKLFLIQDILGFPSSIHPLNTQNIQDKNLWKIISQSIHNTDSIHENNSPLSLAQEFLEKTIHHSTHGDQLFLLIDTIIQKSITHEFITLILEAIHIGKKIKYTNQANPTKNPFYKLPDHQLDALIQQGQTLSIKIKTFNLNAKLALTHYLLQLSRNSQQT